MNHNYYIVTFKNGKKVFAHAMNKADAEILAMARMIKQGLTKEIESTIKTSNLDLMSTADFVE